MAAATVLPALGGCRANQGWSGQEGDSLGDRPASARHCGNMQHCRSKVRAGCVQWGGQLWKASQLQHSFTLDCPCIKSVQLMEGLSPLLFCYVVSILKADVEKQSFQNVNFFWPTLRPCIAHTSLDIVALQWSFSSGVSSVEQPSQLPNTATVQQKCDIQQYVSPKLFHGICSLLKLVQCFTITGD